MRRYGKNPDEDDIRVRPNRKGNRPRTHIRPKHEDAEDGMVLTVDRGRLTCLVEGRTVVAMKARELGRKAAVVGDIVSIVGDLSGAAFVAAQDVASLPECGVSISLIDRAAIGIPRHAQDAQCALRSINATGTRLTPLSAHLHQQHARHCDLPVRLRSERRSLLLQRAQLRLRCP